ncbi:flagellar hook-basal body protein [Priestia taiwanensis]|uniref:Flagellar hook-basal body complex protein FlhP n=1 Tax=Priestia taiwanensis TaxID=1347902 RepID=A0A917ESI6_9BACI|nr:flagellar hook-basal body protein [Priestia taiwanensis]MBM7364353.1 flagellar basal-body rod protein FlgG [Priestia taiwanensis]GGE85129.1 flagellar hook-basal body complex protein FlhP [Priestia taiwanensis]
MNRMMSTATNTMGQLQTQLDIISNNIANLNTTGYKRREANFQEMLYQQFNNHLNGGTEPGRLTPGGLRYGVGAKISHTSQQFTAGPMIQTGRPLDVALEGKDHFFRVRVHENGQDEIRYTKDGSFQLTPIQGNPYVLQLSTSAGHPVLGKDGQPIYVNNDVKEASFSPTGSLVVTNMNGTKEEVDLSVAHINKPHLLKAAGSNLYAWPEELEMDGTVADANDVVFRAGTLEQSNVDMGKEMSELIVTQRSYQFNSKAVTMADQMMGLVNEIR